MPKPKRAKSYGLTRYSPLWVKFYCSWLLALAMNFRRAWSARAGWWQSAGFAYLLSKAADKEKFLADFGPARDSPRTLHIAYHLFFVSQSARTEVEIVGGEFQLAIRKQGNLYRFRLIALEDPDKAPFVHDFFPFTDIFQLAVYDFYDFAGGVVVDVGGYIGDSAVYFAKKGARRVYAYEPNPVNYAYLLKNLELNSVEKLVSPLHCGISSEKRKLIVPHVLGGGGSMEIDEREATAYEVPTVAPGKLFEGEEIVALLKVDCKGCEREIFAHCLPQLRKKVRYVIVQVDRSDAQRRAAMIADLGAIGFRLDKSDEVYRMLYFSNPALL